MGSPADIPHPRSPASDDRPSFAVSLGLLPPYTMEDVKRAYLAKVKDAHPDHGGERAAFDEIQRAFEQAGEYLSFRGDRRQWIAARMDEYVAIEALNERLRGLGAQVETTTHDWVKRSFGEFAGLTESVAAVRLTDSPQVAVLIDELLLGARLLAGLKRLELPGCAVDDRLAFQLRAFSGLVHLDLGRTRITNRAAAIVDFLPQLETFDVSGTSVGWWARQKLQWRLARRRSARPSPALHPTNIR